MSHERTFGIVLLGGLIALLAWLLTKGKTAVTSVSSQFVPQFDVIDPATGAMNFHSKLPATLPPGWEFAEDATEFLKRGIRSAPIGFSLWHDVATGRYWYVPEQIAAAGPLPTTGRFTI